MTMKKLLALLLALCMLLSLTACAETEQEEEDRIAEAKVEFEESDEEKSLSFLDPDAFASGDGAAEEEAAEAKPADEPADEPAEEPEEEPAPEEPAPAAPQSGVPAAPVFEPSGAVPASFEETVLLDDEYCTVTLKSYNPNGSWGAELGLELVNKTENEVMFAARETAVNGIMLDPAWANSVEAVDTETSNITFDREKMDYSGINYLQEVVLGFDVYNNDDWQADHYFTDSFTILLPSDGSGAPNSPVTADFPGYTVVDNADCTIAILDYTEDGYYGPELKVMAVNKSDEAAYFNLEYFVTDGVMLYGSYIEDVLPGTVSYGAIEIDSDDMAASGINYLQDLRLVFEVNTMESYDNLFSGEYAFSLDGGSGPAVEEVRYDGFAEEVLVEADGISITAKNFDMEGSWGPTLTLYLQNETDETAWFDLDTVWINGIEMDPYWATTLLDGTVRYSEVDWDEDDFAEAGITAVETIKLRFTVQSIENWDYLYEGDVTLFLN